MKANALVICALTVLLALQSNVAVAVLDQPVVTNRMIPVDLVLQGSEEDIAVTGNLHVSTRVESHSGSDFVTVHSNFVETKGIGLTTGAAFLVRGSQSTVTEVDLSGPDTAVSSLQWLALQQLAASALGDMKDAKTLKQALLKLEFDDAGRLTVAELAIFSPCSGDD